jgi:hypothetical protein
MSNRKRDEMTMAKLMAELYIILIGLAFGLGAEQLHNHYSLESLLRFVALCAILLIWLHNQLKTGAYEGRNTLFNVGELYLDTASAIFLVCASLYLDKIRIFVILISLSYVFDILVEALFLWETRASKSEHKDERERSWRWIAINLISIFVWVLSFCFNWPDLIISSIILGSVLIGNIYDYRVHSDFYFGGTQQKNTNA